MIDYRVRSMSLLNLVNDIKSGRLIPDAYFQRNLVWRDVHKRDFIDTILQGFPFPQIFISKGKVDVENMSTISCIVDGQQRCSAILSFINGELLVNGKTYSEMDDLVKAEFLKYDVPVIELDLTNDDPRVLDIFQRINRTSTSLTSIEKLASQYSSSEFMLVAKLLADQISLKNSSDDDDMREDPNIPEEFYAWAKKQKVLPTQRLLNEKGVFSSYEIARKTSLMHMLNVMATLVAGFSNRNERAVALLDDYAYEFPQREKILSEIVSSAEVILKMGLRSRSYWLNKANVFTLLVAIVYLQREGKAVDPKCAADALTAFESNLPQDYRLAATEAVNGTKARQLRHSYVLSLFEGCARSVPET